MSQAIYGVYGASGFGKEIMPLLRHQVGSNYDLFFVDDSIEDGSNISLNGHIGISFNDFLAIDTKEKYIAIAIADSKIRQSLLIKCLDVNIKIINIIANNVITLDNVKFGQGLILCPFVTLTSNITIGTSFHANIYSYVAHDCIIGNYVTFAPSVKCNGNVVIGDNAYIGTGVIIKQGKINKPLRIGKGSIVSAGSFVTKNVPDGMTVFGNPAIELTKENMRKMRNG